MIRAAAQHAHSTQPCSPAPRFFPSGGASRGFTASASRRCLCALAPLALLATSGAFPSPASPQAKAQARAAARELFEKAEKQRTALGGKAPKDRGAAEYRRLIAAYRQVYETTPHAVEVPSALLAVAELYHDMGRHVHPRYHQEAIDAYLFLLKHYPTSRFRHDALFTVAQIQREDLRQPDAAENTFREFLSRFPRAPQVAQAREALAAIARERTEARAAARSEVAGGRAHEDQLPQVTRLRHWSGDNFTRVVIDVDETVKWQSARISNPDRIYFDLYQAKLSSTLSGKTFEVAGGFLKAIRVAQNQTGVVRVVLDVDKVKDFSVFLLPNPHRLVVDVYGENVITAKAGDPGPAGATDAGKADAGRSEKAADKAPERLEAAKAVPAKSEPPKGPGKSSAPAAAPAKETERERKEREAAATLRAAEPPQPTRGGDLTVTRALGLKVGRVVIDPGHGGHDTGTIGPTGAMEKEVCLDVALRLGAMLKEKLPGIEVIYTREDDTFIPLEDRSALANQSKADLFISIHANSSRDRNARGIETYYLSFSNDSDALEIAARENALSQSSVNDLQDIIKRIARTEKVEESRELAAELQESLAARMMRVSRYNRDRGVKKAPFVVLIGANMPSVLSEVSFLSNPTDESMLKKAEHRQRVAEGLFTGVRKYLESLRSVSHNRLAASPSAQR